MDVIGQLKRQPALVVYTCSLMSQCEWPQQNLQSSERVEWGTKRVNKFQEFVHIQHLPL